MRKPHNQGELVQGRMGNIDGLHLTHSAHEIQAQSPVFTSITPSLPGVFRVVAV